MQLTTFVLLVFLQKACLWSEDDGIQQFTPRWKTLTRPYDQDKPLTLLALEPECAALSFRHYSNDDMADYSDTCAGDLDVKNNYLVLDIGGGTVTIMINIGFEKIKKDFGGTESEEESQDCFRLMLDRRFVQFYTQRFIQQQVQRPSNLQVKINREMLQFCPRTHSIIIAWVDTCSIKMASSMVVHCFEIVGRC